MNYWPAEVTNLPEMHEPLFQMVKELSESAQGTARTLYDAVDGPYIITRICGVWPDLWMVLRMSGCWVELG